MALSATKIENGLWVIKRWLMEHYGYSRAIRDCEPLEWYVTTGRASSAFLNDLFSAKTFMVARVLHKGGSTEDVINALKAYLERG